jgi:hypothetical protein
MGRSRAILEVSCHPKVSGS